MKFLRDDKKFVNSHSPHDSIENNLNKVNKEVKSIEEAKEIIDFIEKSNKRGLVTL